MYNAFHNYMIGQGGNFTKIKCWGVLREVVSRKI